MANRILFISSGLLGGIHFIFLYLHDDVPIIFYTNVVVGICTSLLNHAFTNPILKWSDRIMMGLGFTTNLVYLSDVIRHPTRVFFVWLLMSSAACYIYCKHITFRNTTHHYPHLVAHLLLTIVHFYMSYVLHHNDCEHSFLC